MAEILTKDNGVLCRSCSRHNAPSALRCVHCGVVLSETTVHVPDKPIGGVPHTNSISQMTRQNQGALVLLIAAQDQPLIFKGTHDIILGRHTDNDTPPTVDLTVYGGHQLGVSRRHAVIHSPEGRYTLEDLGSANGTFVNERRLTPFQPYGLRNGDLVRLGQLMMFAYFSPSRAAGMGQPIEQTLTLVEKEGKNILYQKLTLQRLTRKVLPYLSALATLQDVVNQAVKRPAFDMTLSEIVADKNDETIRVLMVNYPDALRLLREKVLPWRQGRGLTSGTGALSAKPPDATKVLSEGDTPTDKTLPMPPEDPVPTKEALAMYLELAQDILNQVAPGLSDDDQTQYGQKLLLPLYTLSMSRLDVLDQLSETGNLSQTDMP